MLRSDVEAFFKPMTNEENSIFWANVRLKTSSEHSIETTQCDFVDSYLSLRRKILNLLLSKLMVTENTLSIMELKGETTLSAEGQNRENARISFDLIKDNLVNRNEVAVLPNNITTKTLTRTYIDNLPTDIKYILLDKKKYGTKNPSHIIKILNDVISEKNKEIFPFGPQFNKQSGDMSHELYISSLVGLIFLDKLLNNGKFNGFDYDPGKYNIFTKQDTTPLLSMTRRMDGAYPTSVNPNFVWEVKEYFDNKTYGSRVNDSIFETNLSGFECNLLKELKPGHELNHFIFLDGFYCFKKMGQALLLRYIDSFFQGLVDDIIVGTDVNNYWPDISNSIITNSYDRNSPCLLRGL